MSSSKTNRNNRERGKAFEKTVANFLGFWRVPYSGSAESYGLGDVRDHESQEESLTLGECKSITPRSAREINYLIKEKWLITKDGIMTKAAKKNKLGWLAVTKVRSSKWYVVISPEHFRMMLRMIDIMRAENIINDTKNIDLLNAQIDDLWNKHYGDDVDEEDKAN